MDSNILKLKKLRSKIKKKFSIGTWLQIPNGSVAEILGDSGFDWVGIDMEHGSISVEILPDLCRAIELGGSLPFVRVFSSKVGENARLLDAGVVGLIFPKIETASKLKDLIEDSLFPKLGRRGIGFSRANTFGKNLNKNIKLFRPFIVAMIETEKGIENLDKILDVKYLDALFIGPYDLSASLGIAGKFNHPKFKKNINEILKKAKNKNISCGIHIVKPDSHLLKQHLKNGFKFIAYGMDTTFLSEGSKIFK